MGSFSDYSVIAFLALLLFGPKKLPELARYVGKLMGEFRRASSEFRLQMEDEFRLSEQAEQQKKIAAMEAAAPPTPPIEPTPKPALEPALTPPTELSASDVTPSEPETPSTELVAPVLASETWKQPSMESSPEPSPEPAPESLPIATSGELNLMPPATGLPTGRSSSLTGIFDSIPHASETESPHKPEAPHA